MSSIFPEPPILKEKWIFKRLKRYNIKGFWVNLLYEVLYLFTLSLSMALVSLIMDFLITQSLKTRTKIYETLRTNIPIQYLSWVGFTTSLISCAAILVHYVGPSSIGSGIPEIKSVIQGFHHDKYFTLSTLFSKCLGLTMSAGSGLPVGREGPFIHIACILALKLNEVFTFLNIKDETYNRKSELLIAACAVGVACCFSAPIGGVLFSIEVTSTYFKVKNYWKGFFCAISGALIFKLLDIWFYGEEIISVFYKSRFTYNFLLYPQEILLFILVGLICGLMGSTFIYSYKKIILFTKGNKVIRRLMIKYWWVYTIVICIITSSITYPKGMGRYFMADLTQQQIIKNMFYNLTFGQDSMQINASEAMYSTNILNEYVILTSLISLQFLVTLLVITLPIPVGIFIPVFVIGSAVGRLFGEIINDILPHTIIRKQYPSSHMLSGIYSMIGAAALSGSVTRTLSTAVIVFELTGQMTHLLPTMIAVIVSNGVAHCFIPSIYDVIIMTKKIPYLPDIVGSYLKIKGKTIHDIMINNVIAIDTSFTYGDLNDLLEKYKYKEIPVIQNTDSRLFMGSITRIHLTNILSEHSSFKKWQITHQSKEGHIELSVINGNLSAYEIWKKKNLSDYIEWEVLLDNQSIVSTPIQISPHTSLVKVHEIFSLLGCQNLYITNKGQLMGVISFCDMINYINI